MTGIKQIMQKRFLKDAILVIITEKHFLKSRNRLGKRWHAWELYQIKLNASYHKKNQLKLAYEKSYHFDP